MRLRRSDSDRDRKGIMTRNRKTIGMLILTIHIFRINFPRRGTQFFMLSEISGQYSTHIATTQITSRHINYVQFVEDRLDLRSFFVRAGFLHVSRTATGISDGHVSSNRTLIIENIFDVVPCDYHLDKMSSDSEFVRKFDLCDRILFSKEKKQLR